MAASGAPASSPAGQRASRARSRGETPPSQPPGRRRYALALLWTCVVLLASTDPFSAAHTGSILQTIFARFGHPLAPAQFDVLHFLIRKAAHLTEYGILAALWLNALRGATKWSWRLALAAIGIAALVATTDEIHQSFVPSRGPSPFDVMLDIAGATVAVSAMRIKMLLSVSS